MITHESKRIESTARPLKLAQSFPYHEFPRPIYPYSKFPPKKSIYIQKNSTKFGKLKYTFISASTFFGNSIETYPTHKQFRYLFDVQSMICATRLSLQESPEHTSSFPTVYIAQFVHSPQHTSSVSHSPLWMQTRCVFESFCICHVIGCDYYLRLTYFFMTFLYLRGLRDKSIDH